MSGQQATRFRFLAEPPTSTTAARSWRRGDKWIDQVGYAAAVGWSGRTASRCRSPASASLRGAYRDLVTVTAKLVHTGTSSMRFAIDVRARNPGFQDQPEEERLCTHCVIVFVAMDGVEGKPTAVPPWIPQSEKDKHLAEYALKVIEISRGIEETVVRYHQTDDNVPG